MKALYKCIIIYYYYTSDSLWKIWLVESIQSIYNSLWTWHDKCIICCRYYIYHVKFNVCLVTKPPQKQNGWTLCLCFWGWIMWKMYNKTTIEFGFRMISWIIKSSCLCYLPQPSASADNTDLGFDNSWYHAQPHPIIVYYTRHGVTLFFNIYLYIYIYSVEWTNNDSELLTDPFRMKNTLCRTRVPWITCQAWHVIQGSGVRCVYIYIYIYIFKEIIYNNKYIII